MATPSALGGIGRAMANVNFRRYWYGFSLMTIGFWSYRTALGWLVWQLTGSTTWLGLVVFAEMIPMITIGPLAGAIVDRQGSLKMARIATSCWAVAIALMAGVTWAGLVTREVILVLAVLQGAVAGFSNPSHLSLIAKLVTPDSLAPAVALQSGTVQTGRFIGPAVAGPILVASGPALVFTLVTLALLWFLLMLFMARTVEPEKPSESTKSILGDFVEGLQYARSHFGIFHVLIFTALMGLFLRPLPELMPGFADRVFADLSRLPWLLSAFGAGAFVSSVWLAVRGRTGGLMRVFAVNLALGALLLIAFGYVWNIWLALGIAVLFGLTSNTVSVCGQTLTQHMVAGTMRARVMSLMGTTFRAVPALGALMQGTGADAFGLGPAVMAAGALCLVAWLWLVRIIRTTRLTEAAETGPPATAVTH